MTIDRSVRADRGALFLAAVLSLIPPGVRAADLGDPGPTFDAGAPTLRYFPRGDGSETVTHLYPAGRRIAGCLPRRAPVPTNAPDDPSYVGSEYGLGKPSYYGFTPPRGVDDPFGRPLLPYCR